MNEAQYEIHVPAGGQVARVTARYLESQLRVPVHVEPRAVWTDGREQAFEIVMLRAEDAPATDSHVKQTAAYVAEVLNQATILASKTGTGGIETWPVRNTTAAPTSMPDSLGTSKA